METTFLLGPAGSGKTFRIISEVAEELRKSPEGAPLLLLAPKQSTYQLERQILATGEVKGYTRLQVLSFERLALYIFEQAGLPQPDLLSEPTRQMVLTAVLKNHHSQLQFFSQCWNQPGFVELLSHELRALQVSNQSPASLRALAENYKPGSRLSHKLADLAHILELYSEWTAKNQVSDAHDLLPLAASVLKTAFSAPLFARVWMDGFGELSQCELQFLIAVLQRSKQHVLAFCLDTAPTTTSPWLSPWLVAQSSYLRCLESIKVATNTAPDVQWLSAANPKNRFAHAPALQILERAIALNEVPTTPVSPQPNQAISLVQCQTREEEARVAARAILNHVKTGGEYRDCAVLVRNLEPYHSVITRVFTEYGIPFFLDRRKPIRHHPLVRLTETALELAAYGWTHARWFACLKTNLTRPGYSLDTLETLALRFAWQETHWKKGFEIPELESADKVRARQMELLKHFHGLLGENPDGNELATAFETLWSFLEVQQQLADVSDEKLQKINETVWNELESWIKSVRLAFRQQKLSLAEWVGLLQAGLSGLSVGIIPPTLDEVLVGAVDRSRNPDLSLVCVLGLNEGVFPASPPNTRLITETEALEINRHLGGFQKSRMEFSSHERFFFYIAVTRSREKVVVTWAQQDDSQSHLNPSQFQYPLKRLNPVESFAEFLSHQDLHAVEPIRRIVQNGSQEDLQKLNLLLKSTSFHGVSTLLNSRDETSTTIGPELAANLYGSVIKSSISKLELFSACHFQFFVDAGLKGREREKLEFDARNKGTYQHLILSAFHDLLGKLDLKWNTVTDQEILRLLGDLFKHYDQHFKQGLVRQTAFSRLEHKAARDRLTAFIQFLAEWTRRSNYQPLIVETGFGLSGKNDCENNAISLDDGRMIDITRKDLKIPPWHLDLGDGKALDLRGVIDSLGGWIDEAGKLHVVILDFKSSAKKFEEKKFINALQVQLPSYLAAVMAIPEFSERAGAKTACPAGMFYGNLRGESVSGKNRELMEQKQSERFILTGRFNNDLETSLEPSSENAGTAFKSSKNHSLNTEGFNRLLGETKDLLVSAGREILSGSVKINPYREGKVTACQYCKYLTVCRIDDLSHEFRALKKLPEKEKITSPKVSRKKEAKAL
ncbi:MAG: ATP-dependent deoxyribonuclease subunit [Verrucomicrobiales bacterium]|nr:ATP-dependent deoxyribonuclease subunit [Verrucomicrobiales bacterium]